MSRAQSREPVTYGGQAVIDGVMMRGPEGYAVAVRTPDGRIAVSRVDRPTPGQRHPLLKLIFVRGLAILVDSLTVGVQALLWSANQSLSEEDEKLSGAESALAIGIALLVAVGLFMLLPTVVAAPLQRAGASSGLINLAEGLLRLSLLVGYMWLIGRWADVRRVYEYHGAEHKVIHAYGAGADWRRPEAASGFSVIHPRCGTAFLLFVVIISVVLFSFFGWPSLWVRLATRLGLLPVIAGLAYEVIRLSDRTRFAPVRWLVAPGWWLQRLTTREPDSAQLEVAAAALAELEPPERCATPGV